MVTVTDSRPSTTESETGVEVSGRLVTVLPEAVKRTCGSFDRTTRRLMGECGMDRLQVERWYPQMTVLALCEQLESTAGRGLVERIGRFVPELVAWPDHIETVEEGFSAIEGWYDDLHRGGDDSVRFQSTGPGQGEVVLTTPYPDAFEEGLVRGLCREIQTDSMQIYVSESEAATDAVSRYEVSWYRIGSVLSQ